MPSEHDEQVALIQWWAYACKRYGLPEFALFAIPNAGAGAQRGQAGKMKAEGVRRGVCDLFLAVPVCESHGLFIEMKRQKGGHTSPEQRQFVAFVAGRGYSAAVCAGAEGAQACVERYLEPIPR